MGFFKRSYKKAKRYVKSKEFKSGVAKSRAFIGGMQRGVGQAFGVR